MVIQNKIVKEDMDYICKKMQNIEKFDNASFLITGCAGFLGFYIVNYLAYLVDKGVKIKSVILLDTFILGKPEWLKSIENNHIFSLQCYDIAKDNLSSVKGVDEVDYIIHMASIASPVFYRKYPIKTVEANVFGLQKLLEYYTDKDIKGFLFFSSSEIYGNPEQSAIPTTEEYRGYVSCIGPRACYDEAKRFGETMCYLYSKEYDMPIRIVRPFNNYGPGMSITDKRAPADFASSVINQCNITLYSDGSPERAFCYIADAVMGYFKVLFHDGFDYFNIGMDDRIVSVAQLADIYKEIGAEHFNYTGRVVYEISKDKDYLTHNPVKRCPDIEKARTILSFAPEIDLYSGIRRYLQFLTEGRE